MQEAAILIPEYEDFAEIFAAAPTGSLVSKIPVEIAPWTCAQRLTFGLKSSEKKNAAVSQTMCSPLEISNARNAKRLISEIFLSFRGFFTLFVSFTAHKQRKTSPHQVSMLS